MVSEGRYSFGFSLRVDVPAAELFRDQICGIRHGLESDAMKVDGFQFHHGFVALSRPPRTVRSACAAAFDASRGESSENAASIERPLGRMHSHLSM